jgi:DNA-binding beta-propeller fold protein YncE
VFIDAERDLLFTSDRAAARVSVFRCSDETLIAQIDVGPRPNGLAFDTHRRYLYSFNLGEPAGTNSTASVISIDERRVIRTVGLPGRPRWAVFDPSSDRVYVAIQRPAIVLTIDASTQSEVDRIEVGAEGPHGLALVERRLFCAADGGELVVIEGPSVTKRLPLRGAPDVVMPDERGHRLYVAIGSPGVVTTFDTRTLTEIESTDTELGAHTIGWHAASAQLYVFAPQTGGALVFRENA